MEMSVVRRWIQWSLLVLFAVCGGPVAAQQVKDHIALGLAATDAHDLRTALQHFQAALDQDSTSYEANWRAAITLLTLGEQIGDNVKSTERDSLYAQAERYARSAV